MPLKFKEQNNPKPAVLRYRDVEQGEIFTFNRESNPAFLRTDVEIGANGAIISIPSGYTYSLRDRIEWEVTLLPKGTLLEVV